jgi:hypothetical protein
MPSPKGRIADTHRLAGRLERITLVDHQSHRVSLKLLAVRLPTALRLLVHSADLLREPLFRLPPLSESRGLSQNVESLPFGYKPVNISIPLLSSEKSLERQARIRRVIGNLIYFKAL